jgi:hypothetical protein
MFVGRRDDQTIYGAWTNRQWEGQEELSDDNPEVLAFFASLVPPERTPEQKLAAIGLTTQELKQVLGLE